MLFFAERRLIGQPDLFALRLTLAQSMFGDTEQLFQVSVRSCVNGSCRPKMTGSLMSALPPRSA